MENKSNTPIILGIISCIAWIVPILGVIISIIGLVKTGKKIKGFKCTSYTVAIILNIIGILLSIANFAYSYSVIASTIM